MAFRVCIGEDILLDFTLKRARYAVVRKLIEWVLSGRIQAFITPAVLQAVSKRLSEVYGADQARAVLLALLAEVQVIDAGHEVVVNALHSKMGNMPAALCYYTALHHKLDYYITAEGELLKAAIPVLPVCTPEEFLAENEKEARKG